MFFRCRLSWFCYETVFTYLIIQGNLDWKGAVLSRCQADLGGPKGDRRIFRGTERGQAHFQGDNCQ